MDRFCILAFITNFHCRVARVCRLRCSWLWTIVSKWCLVLAFLSLHRFLWYILYQIWHSSTRSFSNLSCDNIFTGTTLRVKTPVSAGHFLNMYLNLLFRRFIVGCLYVLRCRYIVGCRYTVLCLYIMGCRYTVQCLNIMGCRCIVRCKQWLATNSCGHAEPVEFAPPMSRVQPWTVCRFPTDEMRVTCMRHAREARGIKRAWHATLCLVTHRAYLIITGMYTTFTLPADHNWYKFRTRLCVCHLSTCIFCACSYITMFLINVKYMKNMHSHSHFCIRQSLGGDLVSVQTHRI